MQKNETAVIQIEDIGVDGEGIGKVRERRHGGGRASENACGIGNDGGGAGVRGRNAGDTVHEDGYTLFVKDAVIGDVVEVKVMKAKKHYGYARLMRVIKPSPYRVEPVCPYARKCGGCQIQEMSYEMQLKFKEKKVRGNLERIGGFDSSFLDQVMEPIVGMESPFHYRNKAQFPFGTDKNGEPVCGFYAGRTHDIIANTDCALGVDINKEILELILAFMKDYQIPAYDEKTGKGLIRHALIRYGFTTKEIMVCLVINGHGIPHTDELVRRLNKIPGMTSISFSPNTKQTNVIMGDSYEVLWGQGYITDYIGEIRYQISPLSFYQVNPAQTEKLYGLALEYADLKGEETVWDLYCGIGTISLFLAKRAKMVYGVEIVPQAIADARENARRNGIENAEFYVGKAEEVLPGYYERWKEAGKIDGQQASREGAGKAQDESGMTVNGGKSKVVEETGKHGKAHPDVIVVDPPRKGCDETLLRTMVEMQPERIVYVSCDSATLARDLKYLCGNGYELKRGRVVDQFPMGVHTEVVCLLSKLHAKQ